MKINDAITHLVAKNILFLSEIGRDDILYPDPDIHVYALFYNGKMHTNNLLDEIDLEKQTFSLVESSEQFPLEIIESLSWFRHDGFLDISVD